MKKNLLFFFACILLSSVTVGDLIHSPRTQSFLAVSVPASTPTTLASISVSVPTGFVGGYVVFQVPSGTLISAQLLLDGQNIWDKTFAAGLNYGFGSDSTYGVKILQTASLQTITFGWQQTLVFQRSLQVIVQGNAVITQVTADILTGAV